MVQWWERAPPIAVVWDQFPDLVSHVGGSCFWFLSLLPEFFTGSSGFLHSTKNQHSKFQFDLETADKKSHFVDCTLLNSHHLLLLLLLLLLSTLLSLLSQSLLVFFLCISRAQTMHLGHQSPKSIILIIHWAPFWGFAQIPACRSFESLSQELLLMLSLCFPPSPSFLYQAHQQAQGSLRFHMPHFLYF